MTPDLIPGLTYTPRYIDHLTETQLIQVVDQQPWLTDLKRRVQHYGFRYDYKARAIHDTMRLGALPSWASALAERLHQDGFIDAVPDQLIVNEYVPGQGIASHVDCIPCFGDTILSLSLGSTCLMTFEQLKTRVVHSIWVEPGSLLVMKGESRYGWKHGIPARKTDQYKGQKVTRARRISLTFRKVIGYNDLA